MFPEYLWYAKCTGIKYRTLAEIGMKQFDTTNDEKSLEDKTHIQLRQGTQ